MHFSSSHTNNFLIILTREMFKENATNSSEIYVQCFPNKCTSVHQTAISFQQHEFSFTPAGHLQHWVLRHLGFPPPFTQSPLLTLSLEKKRLSIACQNTCHLTRSLVFERLRKHLKGTRLLEMLLVVICKLTLFTETPKTCWHASGLNLAP